MVQTGALLLNTMQLFTNSKVLDLVLDQSQRTHLPIKTPEYSLKTSNKLRRSTSLQQQSQDFSREINKSQAKLKNNDEDYFTFTLHGSQK